MSRVKVAVDLAGLSQQLLPLRTLTGEPPNNSLISLNSSVSIAIQCPMDVMADGAGDVGNISKRILKCSNLSICTQADKDLAELDRAKFELPTGHKFKETVCPK